MKVLKQIFIVIFVFFLAAAAVENTFSQKRNVAEIKRIDADRKATEKFTKIIKEPHLVFADTAEEGPAKWRKFKSQKSLETFREKSETYSISLNWKKNGRIVFSNFTLFSASGDWAKYVRHYFREDGSLAFVDSELRTFYGDYIVNDIRYFDRRGRIISKSVKYSDLTTGKPKKPNDMLSENSMASSTDYFTNTRKLPFAKLLVKK